MAVVADIADASFTCRPADEVVVVARPGGGKARPRDDQWIGTPDPEVYARGTTLLLPEEVAVERAKGNVLTVGELRRIMKVRRQESPSGVGMR